MPIVHLTLLPVLLFVADRQILMIDYFHSIKFAPRSLPGGLVGERACRKWKMHVADEKHIDTRSVHYGDALIMDFTMLRA